MSIDRVGLGEGPRGNVDKWGHAMSAACEKLSQINLLYHFTDRRNLASIREVGGLLPMSELRTMGIQVPAPGGNDWSHDADELKGMDSYVHLCFRATHPMEFRAREAGRIEDSIFLEIHPEVLQWEGVQFTEDVANKSGVEIIPIGEAIELIDFEVLYTRTDWRNPTIQARLQRAEKCEVLVPRRIPLELIRNLPHG